MSQILTVACVSVGTKYGPEYVDRLHNMVKRHLKIPHLFRVISRPPIHPTSEGCWSKLWLFEPMFAPGPILYFDLDVVIVRDIAHLVSDGAFKSIPDFSKRSPFNSSVMSWVESDVTRKVYTEYVRRKPHGKHGPGGADYPGEQEFTAEIVGRNWQPYGNDVLSYKAHCVGDRLPERASVVVFHGRPKMADLDIPWIRDNWR